MSAIADIKSSAQKAAFSSLMEALTRLGYGVRGLIYITMGLLAVQVALGKGGTLASPQGAIAAIGKQPAGLILLWVILVGIISYAVWGVVRAIYDPLDKGHGMKGLLARLGFLVSAFGYAVLSLATYGYITGASQTTNGSQTQKFIASIMAMPWGRWTIGILGLAVLAGGLYQIQRRFRATIPNLCPDSEGSKTGYGRRTVWHLGAWSRFCDSWWFNKSGGLPGQSQPASRHGYGTHNLDASALRRLASGHHCGGPDCLWVLFHTERALVPS
jgi:hypothetical protein